MNTKIFGILALVFVALAGTGVAFGHWYSSVNGNVTVDTGYFQVSVTSTSVIPQVYGNPQQGEVGDSLAQVVACESTPSDTLNITIDNAFPGVEVAGYFNVTNTGTVPAQLNINGTEWNLCTVALNSQTSDPTPQNTWFNPYVVSASVSYNGSTIAIIYVWASNSSVITDFKDFCSNGYSGCYGNNGYFCPGQTVYLHYAIDFLEGLPQNATVTITGTTTFQNYEGAAATYTGP